jgi:putative phosphoribosyl transferase
MKFKDRQAAGKILAHALYARHEIKNAVVLGLPRGGVPIAFEVARACNLPLDVLVVRKLRIPGIPELATGAIASNGTVVLNEAIIRDARISDEIVHAATAHEKEQAERQESLYRQTRPLLSIEDKTAILVDDGLATGATMRAAARAVRPSATKIVIAALLERATSWHAK